MSVEKNEAALTREAPTEGVTDEMVERACKRYAFREDGATWPDAYSEHEVAAERVLMREFLEHVLATPPAPQRMAQGEECTGCRGNGEIGGLTPQGYDSSVCPYCAGSGREATQPPHQDRGEVEQRAVTSWVEPTGGMTAAEAISALRTSNDFYARVEGNDTGGMESAIAVVEKMALALQRLTEASDDSDGACYGTLSTSFVRDLANQPFAVEQKP